MRRIGPHRDPRDRRSHAGVGVPRPGPHGMSLGGEGASEAGPHGEQGDGGSECVEEVRGSTLMRAGPHGDQRGGKW